MAPNSLKCSYSLGMFRMNLQKLIEGKNLGIFGSEKQYITNDLPKMASPLVFTLVYVVTRPELKWRWYPMRILFMLFNLSPKECLPSTAVPTLDKLLL